MFTRFSVEGFRGFSSLVLDDLKPVNLLIGKNGVGKTTILEALFLHVGGHNPELTWRINAWRDLEPVFSQAEETWGWLFHNKRVDEPIEIRSLDEKGMERFLKVELGPATRVVARAHGAEKSIVVEKTPGATSATIARQLQMTLSAGDKDPMVSSATMHDDRMEAHVPSQPVFPLCVFVSTRVVTPKEDARRFEAMEEVGRENEVVDILKILEPRLSRLSTATRGESPIIRADIGTGRLLPIGLLGQGFVRLAKMALAVLSAKHGVVMVDEIDSGLHHTVQKLVWDALAEASSRSNVQLFATTHSRECVASAHQAFSERLQYELAVFRLESERDGIHVTRYSKDTLETSLKLDMEVR